MSGLFSILTISTVRAHTHILWGSGSPSDYILRCPHFKLYTVEESNIVRMSYCLQHPQCMMVLSLVLSMSRDPDPGVCSAAVRTLGVFVTYPSLFEVSIFYLQKQNTNFVITNTYFLTANTYFLIADA